MITGNSGCGKTSTAKFLAAELCYPMIEIDANRCLRGRLGESEDILRHTLFKIKSIPNNVLVLFDNVHRFFEYNNILNDISSVKSTMTRMSSIILNFLDSLDPHIIILLTANSIGSFPDQWQRRIQIGFHLPDPVNNNNYRSSVFKNVFSRFKLDLEDNAELMKKLAKDTDPTQRLKPLSSPMAKASNSTHSIKLKTGADILSWVKENIIIFGQNPKKNLQDADFWENAAL